MDKLVRNCFNFELVFKKVGRINIKTAIREIAGIISCNPIFNFSKNF